MKRTELVRRTPLAPGRPLTRATLVRSSPLPKHGRSRMGTTIPLAVRREVRDRANGVCERCLSTPGVHWHHRQKRSQGGQHTAANGVWLCLACHDTVHSQGEQAYATGWLVRRGVDPATVHAVPLGVVA